jgi:hypothetical protein
MMSTLKENGKFTCYNRDMEIISNYIKNNYFKYRKYPKTKMNFHKYSCLLGKGAFGKVNLSYHVLFPKSRISRQFIRIGVNENRFLCRAEGFRRVLCRRVFILLPENLLLLLLRRNSAV